MRATVAERALAAGTDTAEIEVERDVRTATVEGQRSFIEARIVAVAAGRGRASPVRGVEVVDLAADSRVAAY